MLSTSKKIDKKNTLRNSSLEKYMITSKNKCLHH